VDHRGMEEGESNRKQLKNAYDRKKNEENS
jgi:hypothetical protein